MKILGLIVVVFATVAISKALGLDGNFGAIIASGLYLIGVLDK